jgi:2-aminoethylphosphonate-pyruvate transaminase
MLSVFQWTHNKRTPLLLCPGPVMLSKRVRKAAANISMGHREAEFSELLAECREMLMPVVGVDQATHNHDYEVIFVTGSGTATNELVLSSIGSLWPVLILSNGEFGERLAKMAGFYGSDTVHLAFGWQVFFDLDRIEAVLKRTRPKLVVLAHHETSTGMLNPIATVSNLAHRYGALVMVDAISSIGAEEIKQDEWDIDILVGTSGKALSAMPGVGIVIAKRAVFDQLALLPQRCHYLDLANHLRYMREQMQTPNTPAVHVFASLHATLQDISARGPAQTRRLIRQRALEARQQLVTMGLEFADYMGANSSVLTCVRMPSHLNYELLAGELKKKGIVIYGGKGMLRRKVFQIGHIGALGRHDTHNALCQLEAILRKFSRHQLEVPLLSGGETEFMESRDQ